MGPGVMPRDNAKTLQLLNILEDPKAAKKLMRLTLQIPVNWSEQRKLLGFQ